MEEGEDDDDDDDEEEEEEEQVNTNERKACDQTPPAPSTGSASIKLFFVFKKPKKNHNNNNNNNNTIKNKFIESKWNRRNSSPRTESISIPTEDLLFLFFFFCCQWRSCFVFVPFCVIFLSFLGRRRRGNDVASLNIHEGYLVIC